MKIYGYILAVTLLLLSCERNANNVVDLPTEDAKFVLFAKPEAGQSLNLFIEKSKGILDLGSTAAPNNTVINLKDGNGIVLETVTSIPSDTNRVEFINTLFEIGKTYEIEVSHDDIEHVEHSFTIPDTISLGDLTYQRTVEESEWDEDFTVEVLEIEVDLDDIENETNYYWIEFYARYTVKSNIEDDFEVDIAFYDSIVDGYAYFVDSTAIDYIDVDGIGNNPIMNDFGDGRAVINDQLINGQTYTIQAQIYVYEDDYYYSIDTIEIVTKIYKVEKGTSDYYVSLEKYRNTEDNPFTEPVQVFSNVTNGYGVILPRSGTTKTYKIPF